MRDVKIVTYNHFGPVDHIMLVDRFGSFKFVNLIHTSEVPFTNKPKTSFGVPINCHPSFCTNKEYSIIICVFKKIVVEIEFKLCMTFLMTEFRVIYSIQTDNEILSSALSENASSIILGTKKGVIVVDRLNQMETLRSHVGEEILSLDLHGVDESDFGSILISVFNNITTNNIDNDSKNFVSLDGSQKYKMNPKVFYNGPP